jgi:D-inositol-3-phosphate glycosyltransferase
VDHTLFAPGDRREAREALGIGGDGPLVLFAGRVQPLKGLDVAIRAFEIVARSLPDARLLVVGGASGERGPAEMAAMLDLVAELGLADRVAFHPPLPHREVPVAYRAADVLVVPSRSESFGLVAAEAQACGIPVVAAAVGGLPYVVADGRSGLLVDGRDPGGFAAALLRVLGDRNLAEDLARGALVHAEQFSWRATTDRLLELYSGMVEGRGREKSA